MKLRITYVHDLFAPICIIEVPMEVPHNVADVVDGSPRNTRTLNRVTSPFDL